MIQKHGYILIHLLISLATFFILRAAGITSALPGNHNLANWDAGWYHSIVQHNYVFQENEQINLAFFPLFPFLWKLLNVSFAGISIINGIIFYIGFFILSVTFNIPWQKGLVLLSVPSLFFCFVAYTEALFYLCSVCLLCGLKLDNKPLKFAGAFLAGLTRPTAMLFIPAIIFCELVTAKKERKSLINAVKSVAAFSFVCLLSLFTVAFIQYSFTGKWFYFFEVQQYWDKVLRIPGFPLTTWQWDKLLWLDGWAFATGALALCAGAILFFLWCTNKTFTVTDRTFTYSLAYIFLVMLTDLFYAPVVSFGNSSINSLNRYVFSTAFYSIFLLKIMSAYTSRALTKQLPVIASIIIALSCFLAVCFGIFHIDHHLLYWNYLILLGYLLMTFFLVIKPVFNKAWPAVYIINLITQIILYDWYLDGKWLV